MMPETDVETARVFADFHNVDAHGRLRLNCAGTREDLDRQQIELREGLSLVLYSEDLEAIGTAHFSQEESLWVAAVDWNAITHCQGEATTRCSTNHDSPFYKLWVQICDFYKKHHEDADAAHSALLRRLMENKPPLPFPPPLRFSYPDYPLAEGVPRLVGEIENVRMTEVKRVIIDQSGYWEDVTDSVPVVDNKSHLLRWSLTGERYWCIRAEKESWLVKAVEQPDLIESMRWKSSVYGDA